MVAVTDSKNGRAPNVQPNNHSPELVIEVLFDGKPLEANGKAAVVRVAQDPFLSKAGNVLYFARISKGWKLPEGALEKLSFVVNGNPAHISAAGVHDSAPRLDKSNRAIAGTGGDPMVTHTIITECAEGVDYMVNIITKQLPPKAGKGQGHSLRIQGVPKAVGRTAGPQVVGDVEGLVLDLS